MWAFSKVTKTMYSVFPNGPIFSDLSPKLDFFKEKGQKMVSLCTLQSGFDQVHFVSKPILVPKNGGSKKGGHHLSDF